MSETTSILGGVRVIESKWLPAESRWKIFADWRARLARNLSRRSTARWEPLDDGQTPNVFLIGGNLYANPRVVAGLILATAPSLGDPDP